MTIECPTCGETLEVEDTRSVIPHRDPAMWERIDAALDEHERVHW